MDNNVEISKGIHLERRLLCFPYSCVRVAEREHYQTTREKVHGLRAVRRAPAVRQRPAGGARGRQRLPVCAALTGFPFQLYLNITRLNIKQVRRVCASSPS